MYKSKFDTSLSIVQCDFSCYPPDAAAGGGAARLPAGAVPTAGTSDLIAGSPKKSPTRARAARRRTASMADAWRRVPEVLHWAEVASGLADAAVAESLAARRSEWRSWASSAVAGGAGAAHRYIKWNPSAALREYCGLRAGLQTEVSVWAHLGGW